MVILGMDLTIHFVNIALMKVLNESKSRLALIELLKLKNC